MQRRAAAAYFAFFLVVSVAAYAYIGVAESQRPEVSLEESALTNDSSFTVGDTTYTVSNIHSSSGGSHGGGGAMVADLTWTNNSSRYTATIEDGSTTTVDNTTYNVSTDGPASTMTLTEELNVTQLLRDDTAIENTTATQDGTEYVVYRANDSLRPLAEWLPDPKTRTYAEGDSFVYAAEGGPQQTSVANVTNSSATVEWVAPRDRSVELSEGGNVTVSGQQRFAHFPNHSTVVLANSDQYSSYQQTLSDQTYFNERKNGLWGVSILSGIASVLMLGMAYLPQRG